MYWTNAHDNPPNHKNSNSIQQSNQKLHFSDGIYIVKSAKFHKNSLEEIKQKKI